MSIYSKSNKLINIINKNPISSHPSIDGGKFFSETRILSLNTNTNKILYAGSIISTDSNINQKNTNNFAHPWAIFMNYWDITLSTYDKGVNN